MLNLKIIFDINTRPLIKLKKKGLNLIEKCIIYSLPNIVVGDLSRG